MPETRSSATKLQQSKLTFEPALSEEDTPPRRPGRNKGATTQSQLTSYLKPNENSESVPLASSQLNLRQSSPDYPFGEAETSGDEGIFTTPQKTRTYPKKKTDDFVVPDDEVEE